MRTRSRGRGTVDRRNLASDWPPRRRRSPSRSPPLPPCASAQSRTGNLRSSRAQPSPRFPLLTRATSLSPPRNRPRSPPTFPTRRARCRERSAGTPPLPRIPTPDPPRLRPPSLYGARSRKEPKRRRKKPKQSSRGRLLPKRRRKEPKLCERGGVSEWRVRKEPKAGIALNRWRGLRASAGNLWKGGSPGRLRLSEVADCFARGRWSKGKICGSGPRLGRFA